MKLDDIDDLEKNYEPIEKGIDEYVWIHATGVLITDAGKVMLEQGLALSVDAFITYPMYLKNGKAKLKSRNDSVVLLVERERLEDAMSTLRSICEEDLQAYALPVLAIETISPPNKSIKEILFGR